MSDFVRMCSSIYILQLSFFQFIFLSFFFDVKESYVTKMRNLISLLTIVHQINYFFQKIKI